MVHPYSHRTPSTSVACRVVSTEHVIPRRYQRSNLVCAPAQRHRTEPLCLGAYNSSSTLVLLRLYIRYVHSYPLQWLATGIYGSILSTDVILTCTLVFVLARRRTGRRPCVFISILNALVGNTYAMGVEQTLSLKASLRTPSLPVRLAPVSRTIQPSYLFL